MKVIYDYKESDGTTNRLVPRDDFAHTTKANNNTDFIMEQSEDDLARWVLDMKNRGEKGRARMRSPIDGRNGLYSVKNLEVIL